MIFAAARALTFASAPWSCSSGATKLQQSFCCEQWCGLSGSAGVYLEKQRCLPCWNLLLEA